MITKKIMFVLCLFIVGIGYAEKPTQKPDNYFSNQEEDPYSFLLKVGFLSKYIMEVEVFKSTSKEVCAAFKMEGSSSEINQKLLSAMRSDPNIERVRCVVRFIKGKDKMDIFLEKYVKKQKDKKSDYIGRCKYDTHSWAQYLKKQKDGTYILSKTVFKDGGFIDLQYATSSPEGKVKEGYLFIKGTILIDKVDKREPFKPFSLAKMGKPISGFGIVCTWNDFTPIPINKEFVISKALKNDKEVVFAKIRIVPSKNWKGKWEDVLNKNSFWFDSSEIPESVKPLKLIKGWANKSK